MANRKNLKKTIHYIAENLMSELSFKCLTLGKKIDEEQISAIAADIQAQERDFVARISHSSGKDRKMVKAYYQNLYSEWDKGVGEIFDRIEAL